MALLLRAKGIHRVRPLEGGIDAWLADDFPFVTESLVKNPLSFERTYFFAATYPFRSDISLDQLR